MMSREKDMLLELERQCRILVYGKISEIRDVFYEVIKDAIDKSKLKTKANKAEKSKNLDMFVDVVLREIENAHGLTLITKERLDELEKEHIYFTQNQKNGFVTVAKKEYEEMKEDLLTYQRQCATMQKQKYDATEYAKKVLEGYKNKIRITLKELFGVNI